MKNTGTAPKVMPPILFGWFMTSEANVGGMAVEVEPSHQYPITCCCRVTDGSRGASDMEVYMKQKCVIELLHTERIGTH